MCPVKIMNTHKKAGTLRSKKNSTVSTKAHKDMKVGWPKRKRPRRHE